MLTDVDDVTKDDSSSGRRMTLHSIDAILKPEKPRGDENQERDQIRLPHTDITGMKYSAC
jgi:hypothetical protein